MKCNGRRRGGETRRTHTLQAQDELLCQHEAAHQPRSHFDKCGVRETDALAPRQPNHQRKSSECASVCTCVCVCVKEFVHVRQRERESFYVCVFVYICIICMCMHVHVCVVCVCVCLPDERLAIWVFHDGGLEVSVLLCDEIGCEQACRHVRARVCVCVNARACACVIMCVNACVCV